MSLSYELRVLIIIIDGIGIVWGMWIYLVICSLSSGVGD